MDSDAHPVPDDNMLAEFEEYLEDPTQKGWIREYRLSDMTAASLLRAVLGSLERDNETQDH